jgi:hypothetical protein
MHNYGLPFVWTVLSNYLKNSMFSYSFCQILSYLSIFLYSSV